MRVILLLMLGLSACAPMAAQDANTLPAAFAGTLTLVPSTDPAYGQANAPAAEKPSGQGGVTQALVVRLGQDMPVYRLWNGPQAVGQSNRLGSWWAFDAPKGTREGYRRAYEICGTWNELKWVATCTLKAGAVVAIGPGQSVSAVTCNDTSGYETYDVNRKDWQVFINQAWNRPTDLVCPPETADYAADPANVAQPVK